MPVSVNETPKEPVTPPEITGSPAKGGGRPLLQRATLSLSASSQRARAAISPLLRRRPVQAVLAALALVLVGVTLVVIFRSEPEPAPEVVEAGIDAGELADAEAPPANPEDAAAPPEPPKPPPPPPWRVSSLRGDAAYDVKEVTIGHRTVNAALLAAGLSKAETHRVIVAFDPVHKLDRTNPKDLLIIAKEKRGGRVFACEYSPSPTMVWQARDTDSESHTLTVKKLEFLLSREQKGYAITVGSDLRQSFSALGLGEAILAKLDDALDGHAELSDLHAGTFLRLLVSEERVVGGGVLGTEVDAVEYNPPSAKSLRVYLFDSEEPGATKVRGFYDQKGRRPMHGGFRKPIPFARIASRFNPQRMHPVLHVVMPHNGVDFAASTGTPVYSTAQGTVRHVGDGGPCGNMVQVEHSNNLVSAYCHLSRFASGLHPGQHVEAAQLIGYVGATGRVTGPHLHFAMKRGGVFIDPLRMALDGERVLPRRFRDDFNEQRGRFDLALDAVTRAKVEPPASPEPPAHEEPEVFYEEVSPDVDLVRDGGGTETVPEDAAIDPR